MLTIIIILCSFLLFVMSLAVFLKNRSSLTNILFSLLVFSQLGWVVANYASLSDYALINTLTAVRLILFFAVISNTLFLLFAKTFPAKRISFQRSKLVGYLTFSVFTALLTLSPLVFSSVQLEGDIPITETGPGMLFFAMHATLSIILGFRELLKKMHNSEEPTKRQLKYLLLVSVLIWIFVPVTNFLFTQAFRTTFFVQGSPVYTLLFMSLVAYTIVAHKLFDIRALLARSIVYIFVLGLMSLIYAVSIFGVLNTVFSGPDQESARQILSVVLIAPLLLSFQATKNYFDKISSRIFYKDSYSTQKLLDELNQVLVSDVEINSLLEKTSKLVADNLKASYCGFYIRETAYFSSRFVAISSSKIPGSDLEKIRQLTPEIKNRIYTVALTPENNEENILQAIMRKNNIEVLGRLVSTLKYEVAGVGYLLAGPKQSGAVYSEQDLKVLEIISNELVLAVENALRLEEIEQFNVTLQKKIDAATKELKDSNHKLKALDEAKDEFVSMASHQLRTPLTSIKGYISMVLEGDAGEINDTQKKMLGQAFFSSQRMVYLISDLLNVSRLKTGKFIIEPKPVNLANIVDSELEQLQEGAGAKNQTLSFTKPKDFPIMSLDDMKIRQVIMNFTDNAIYYTPPGGKITVELKDTGKSVEFIVKDSGIGVPKKEQHKLFAKFYRAENARKARPDGTGLGLFMAKKVIIAQGGAIIFSSKEGKGSTFGFSFPKDKLEVEETKK